MRIIASFLFLFVKLKLKIISIKFLIAFSVLKADYCKLLYAHPFRFEIKFDSDTLILAGSGWITGVCSLGNLSTASGSSDPGAFTKLGSRHRVGVREEPR